MAKYRSGKLPKAFKVIPSLSNWEEVSLKQGSSTLFHFSMPQQGFDPLTPMSDQDRISPHNFHTISCRKVMRIERNINQGIIS